MTDYCGNAGTDTTGYNGWGMMGDGRDGAIPRRGVASKRGGWNPSEFPRGISNVVFFGEKRYNQGLSNTHQTDDDSGRIDGHDWDIVRWGRDLPEPDWRETDPAFAHSGYASRHAQFGGPHEGGCMFSMVDGSVKFVPYTLDADVWHGMVTRE